MRACLHLNRSSADSFIHAPRRLGGLGVTSWAAHIPSVIYKRVVNLGATADTTTAAVMSLPSVEKLFERVRAWSARSGTSARVIGQAWGASLEGSYSGNGLLQGATSSVSSS